MAATLPTPPSIATVRAAGVRADELLTVDTGTRLWRVHRTRGDDVLGWNQLRGFGPLLRFDHHPHPRGEHPGYGIWYGACSPRAALAEAFQSSRVIDCHRGDPYLTGFTFSRPLRQLDVGGFGGGAWPTRVGGTHALDSAPHSRAQHWARTVHRAHHDIDGIAYRGRFAGDTCLAVFERATDAIPTRPDLSLPLHHSEIAPRIATAARDLGYTVI